MNDVGEGDAGTKDEDIAHPRVQWNGRVTVRWSLPHLGTGLLEGLAEAVDIETPVGLFIQMVRHQLASVQCHTGRVQRVLGNWDHNCHNGGAGTKAAGVSRVRPAQSLGSSRQGSVQR